MKARELASTQAYFAHICADYDQMIVRCVPRYEEMLDQLLDALPLDCADGRILELGVGSGALTARYLTRYPTAHLTGVDLSFEMLRAARQRCAGLSLPVSLLQGRFESLPFQAASFDLIVSSISLHHLQDKLPVLQHLRALLRPGGALLVADQFRGATERIHSRNWSRWLAYCEEAGASREEIRSWLDHAEEHDHYESIETHFEYLRRAGFERPDCLWRHLIWGLVIAENACAP